MLEMPDAEVRNIFETNVFSLLRMTRVVVRTAMLPRRSGRVINVGSVLGCVVSPWSGAYCSSKSAVHAMSDALRWELAPFGIEVCSVR